MNGASAQKMQTSVKPAESAFDPLRWRSSFPGSGDVAVQRFRFLPLSKLELCDTRSDPGLDHILYIQTLIED